MFRMSAMHTFVCTPQPCTADAGVTPVQESSRGYSTGQRSTTVQQVTQTCSEINIVVVLPRMQTHTLHKGKTHTPCTHFLSASAMPQATKPKDKSLMRDKLTSGLEKQNQTSKDRNSHAINK